MLPGEEYTGTHPDGFASAHNFVSSLEAYSLKFQLPVIEQTEVIAIEKPAGEKYFTIIVSERRIIKIYQSRQVIICSGCQNTKKVPAFAKNISSDIIQLHASEYRNASRLPDGAVLVVGSAQSGCQITEDLMESGRKVFLSTSLVPRIPRRYRGKDIMGWLIMLGFFDLKKEEVTDPNMFHMKAPQISGTGEFGHTISLQDLGRRGTVIVGSMENADEYHVFFNSNAREHVRFADEFSKKAKGMIDEYILKNQLNVLAPQEDRADHSDL